MSRDEQAAAYGQGLPPAGGWKRHMTGPDELERLRQENEEQAAFIGHKGLGDEFTEWALARRAEIDRLLAETKNDA